MKLKRPIVLAPMAGGVTTPELCAEVAKEGGLPFIASGYLSLEELSSQITKYNLLCENDYGINIFFPEKNIISLEGEYTSYRDELIKSGGFEKSTLPPNPIYSNDNYDGKVEIAINSSAKYISFTFGHPAKDVIERIQEKGKKVILYATSKDGIDYIASSKSDIIGIQGIHAGGHRATVKYIDSDDVIDIEDLITYAVSISDKPVIAGGGVSSANDVLRLVRKGATAVQVGTFFLLANESGTKETHRKALLDLRERETILTKSFTGKLARAIENSFTKIFSDCSIDFYPQIHFLTKEIRKQADLTGNIENLHLWAGTGFSKTYCASAKQIIRDLTPYIYTSETKEDNLKENTRIGVIGAGPRGLALIERVISNFNDKKEKIIVDWFDDSIHGAGKVWDPYNTNCLLMNTVCSQLSSFPDRSSDFADSYVGGPTLYEWLQSEESFLWLERDSELLNERQRLSENCYSSRCLYGTYLIWSARRILKNANHNVVINIKHDRVLSIEKNGDKRTIITSRGHSLDYDFLCMPLGHITSELSNSELNKAMEFKESGILYIPTGDATLQRSLKIKKQTNVLFLGIGLTFFDYIEMLTTQRGGVYKNTGDDLEYIPSVEEPYIYMASRTGMPYHARGKNEKRPEERWLPRFITEDYLKKLNEDKKRRELSFGRDIWNMIVKEVELSYTLTEAVCKKINIDEYKIKKSLGSGFQLYSAERVKHGLASSGFPWERVLKPELETSGIFNIDEYQHRAIAYLEHDITEACGGNKNNPFKAALDVLRDIRNEVRLSVQGGNVSDRSYQDEISYFYTPMNTFLSIGPPVQRIKELKSLIQAGVAKIIPPTPFINHDHSLKKLIISFREPFVDDIEIDSIVEARQQKFDATTCSDPLVSHSMRHGIFSPHTYSNGNKSGAINIAINNFNIIDKNNQHDSKMYCYGIPMEGLTWGTAATIRPFVNSVIFQDANKIAKELLKNIKIGINQDKIHEK